MDDVDFSADRFVMLFSADWFRPYWRALGINIRGKDAEAFQAAMRTETSNMIGQEEEYYSISFEASRAKKTRAKLLDALSEYAEPTSNFGLINLHGLSRDERRDIQGPLLLDHYDDWQMIKQTALNQTDWDGWLVRLTPTEPESLRNFAMDAAGLI